jgi:hypothetical protein
MDQNPTPPLALRPFLAEAAAALAERLRAGALPKAERAAARRELNRAFEALEAEADPPMAFVREIDTLAAPPLRWPGGRVRIGLQLRAGCVDPVLLNRIWAYCEAAERVSARIDAFVESTGGEPLRLFVAEVRPGERDAPEMAFTEG